MEGTWQHCVVALGANLGDRHHEIFTALADIRATEGFVVEGESSLHETVALRETGPDPDAPGYINQVITLRSAWSPERTLAALHDIEAQHGRVRTGVRYADRTLDLDLITYGDVVLDSEHLTLPHPRAHQRRFVLEPWLEIEPNAALPGLGPISELLAELPPNAS